MPTPYATSFLSHFKESDVPHLNSFALKIRNCYNSCLPPDGTKYSSTPKRAFGSARVFLKPLSKDGRKE